ncbi:uncharacterized protein [Haliotis asinina]|uniref:uncharacterized protein n=1 Tax=Haliotis asinina TaxID=109174 RepID=UPI003531B13F
MFTALLVTGALWLFPEIVALERIKCYKDGCERGVQYCVEERQRCYNCDDVKHLCGTEDLPLQCDAFCAVMTALEQEKQQNERIREVIQRSNTTIEMLQHDIATTNQSLHNATSYLQRLQANNDDLRNTIAASNVTVKTLKNDIHQLQMRNEDLQTKLAKMSYLHTNHTIMAKRQSDPEQQLEDQKIAIRVLSGILLTVLCVMVVLFLVLCRCRPDKQTLKEKRSLVGDTDLELKDTKTTLNFEESITKAKADFSHRDQEEEDAVSDDSAVVAGSSAESVNAQECPREHNLDGSGVKAKGHPSPTSDSPDHRDVRCDSYGSSQDTRGINPTPDDQSADIRLAIDKPFNSVYKHAAMRNNAIRSQEV